MKYLVFIFLIAVSILDGTPVFADQPGFPIVKLVEGQWVELRDKDPVRSNREVRHIWLHRGTLLFDVTRVEGKPPFRDAITYFGLPVRIQAKKRGPGWYIEDIKDPKRSSFHLTRNVFCPGESNPIILKGNCLRGGAPIGEGYVFDLRKVDADKDGNPDKKNSLDYYEAGVTLYPETAAALGVSRRFVFVIYEKDLDRYEKDGVLFRLDRRHPQREIRFLDSDYQPCGSTKTSELKKEKTLEAYVEAEGKAGFDFWGWLKASLKVVISKKNKDSDTDTIKLTTTTEGGTTFRQWGLIFDYSVDPSKPQHQTAFFVEKVFECRSNVGQITFGDRINGIEIGLFDHFTKGNIEFEFSHSEDLQELNDKIFDQLDKPVFISINDSERQAAMIDKIKVQEKIKDHYLAAFIFAQLNLACPEVKRKNCRALNESLR